MKLPNVWTESFTDYINNQLKNEAARLFRTFQLESDRTAWQKKRIGLREQIWECLGTGIDHKLDLEYREYGSIRMDGYSVKRITYQSRPGFHVTANLYVPDGKGPFPGVVNMHGHWSQGRLAERVQARGHSLAKNGYVCLSVDAFGSGERSIVHGVYEYHGSNLGASLMNVGETLMGLQVVDNMRGVDLLCSMEFVDKYRIGATGASGGGNQTMWLAAMDDRISAAVPVVSVGSFQSYVTGVNCVCELLPEGLTFTEESGVLALTAPRALKICNCLHDSNHTFFPSEMLRTFKETRKIYQTYGSDDKLSYQIFNLSHGYWPEIREAMLGWFDLHLKDKGHGAPKTEIPFYSLPEKDVMVFEKGNRPSEVVTIPDFCIKRGSELRKERLGRNSIDVCAEKENLSAVLHLGIPLKTEKIVEYGIENGWEKFALVTECGRMIPLLVKHPAEKGRDYTILCHPEGKDNLADSKLLGNIKSGDGVILLDLWGTGETASPDVQVVLYHNLSRSALWLGRTMMGEWVRDLKLAVEFARGSLKARQVRLCGVKEAGLAALFAAVFSEGISSVTLCQSPVSYLFSKEALPNNFFSMAVHLPGFLKWGDVSLAAGLSGSKVKFYSPVRMDGTDLSVQELMGIEGEFSTIRDKCGTEGCCEFTT